MAAALIVIEVSAPAVSDDALAVLVSSCSRAARDAECVLAKNANDDQRPDAVAIVSLQGEDKLRVEVGVRDGDRDSWRSKEFAFLAADELLDRWRAVGFAIGTLAEREPPPADAEPALPASPSPEPAESTPAPASERPKPVAEPRTAVFVGAGALFGPGLDAGPWRLGSAVSLDIAPPRFPLLFALGGSAATRVTSDESGATLRWFDISGGVVWPLLGPPERSGLELGGAVVAEYFDAHANAFGDSQSNSRWLMGAQGSLGGRLRLVQDLLLTLDVSATGFAGSTDVRVAGAPIGSAGSFRSLATLGLRVRLR